MLTSEAQGPDPDQPPDANDRPENYIRELSRSSKSHLVDVYQRVHRAYKSIDNRTGRDIAQEALVIVMDSRSVLRGAPPLAERQQQGWAEAVVDALVAFALGKIVRQVATARAWKGYGVYITRRDRKSFQKEYARHQARDSTLCHGPNRNDSPPEAWPNDSRPTPLVLMQSLSTHESVQIEDDSENHRQQLEEDRLAGKSIWKPVRCLAMKVWARTANQRHFVQTLHLLAQLDGDSPLRAGNNEVGKDDRLFRCGNEKKNGTPQMNHEFLLRKLQEWWPSDGWTIGQVRNMVGKYRKFAIKRLDAAAVRRLIGPDRAPAHESGGSSGNPPSASTVAT